MDQELKRKTLVIGHRNPDTDSICSAVCYANLKRAVTGEEYIPARAGHVNGETRFVLDYFGMEEPALVEMSPSPVTARFPDWHGDTAEQVNPYPDFLWPITTLFLFNS